MWNKNDRTFYGTGLKLFLVDGFFSRDNPKDQDMHCVNSTYSTDSMEHASLIVSGQLIETLKDENLCATGHGPWLHLCKESVYFPAGIASPKMSFFLPPLSILFHHVQGLISPPLKTLFWWCRQMKYPPHRSKSLRILRSSQLEI